MPDALAVVMGDRLAGVLRRLSGGKLEFEYDDAYREHIDAVQLSVSMPLTQRLHRDDTITPWLWGLLPDNDAVLNRWARQFHVSASSPFALLATPVGEDCAGAGRFVALDVVDQALNRRGDVTWLTEDDVAQRLRELQADSTAWLGREFTGQFSLAGVQAKTALLRRDQRWGVPHGPIPTTHILKPAVVGFDQHDLNEHLSLDAARRAGLLVARTRIARFANTQAIVIDRYDRVEPAGEIVRVHQEDICQAFGIHPSRKYQNEGGPSPNQIVALFRRTMPSTVAEDAVWRFADALAWNWVIGGTDGHAKNYSLLISSDQVRLAPLYDIASALPYGTHEKKLRLAMKVGGSYDVFPYRNTWPKAAIELGVEPEALVERVRELVNRAPDAFADAARDSAVVALETDLPCRLTNLITDRARRCLDVLDSSPVANVASR